MIARTHRNNDNDRASLLLTLKRLEGQKDGFGLMALNIRGFRKINATYGHEAGDRVLAEVVERIHVILREQDRLYHIGGDEFAILLDGLRNPQQMILAASRIETAFRGTLSLDGEEIRIRLQMAGCTCPEHGTLSHELLQRLDAAMQQGRERNLGFCFFDVEHEGHEISDLALEGALEDAIRLGQFELHFQPKIDLASRMACGGEALSRWHHPTLGWIRPDRFIPLLEHSDLVIPFTEWVLNAALRQCSDCRRTFGCLSVAVNLSARSLHDPHLADLVFRTMQLWDTEPGSLTVEITESAIMHDPERCLDTLHTLHDRGVRISIDDFGTGYSSLAYLQQLPASEVKIDKSFVKRMASEAQDDTLVRSIIDLGHNLGLKVVAEGVEDEKTLDRLAGLGCDQAQGYFIAKPMPGTDMKTWLLESPWGVPGGLQACNIKV